MRTSFEPMRFTYMSTVIIQLFTTMREKSVTRLLGKSLKLLRPQLSGVESLFRISSVYEVIIPPKSFIPIKA